MFTDLSVIPATDERPASASRWRGSRQSRGIFYPRKNAQTKPAKVYVEELHEEKPNVSRRGSKASSGGLHFSRRGSKEDEELARAAAQEKKKAMFFKSKLERIFSNF